METNQRGSAMGMGKKVTQLAAAAVFVAAGLGTPAAANVDIVLEPARVVKVLGCDEVFDVEVWLIPDDGQTAEVAGLDIVFTWNAAHLEFVHECNCKTPPPGCTPVPLPCNGSCPFLGDGFFPDGDGINTDLDDGNVFYSAFTNPSVPLCVPAGGAVLTKLRFKARGATPFLGSGIEMQATYGDFAATGILGSKGEDLTGDISSTVTAVVVDPCACVVGDVNVDGQYTEADITAAAQVLLGVDTNPAHVAATDANCDMVADGDDLQPLLNILLAFLN